MKQAVMMKPHLIKFVDIKINEPKDNEVLLKVMKIGVCGSDIHVWHGKHPYVEYPVVQGHEVSCIVEKIGRNVENVSVGDKVTVQPQIVCNKCLPCRTGRYNICQNLKVMGFQTTGLASEYFITDANKVIKLPDSVSLDDGIFIEPLAVAVHALRRSCINFKGANVLVLGAGTIGNLVAQTAKALGAKKVIITDVSDYRLDVAKRSDINRCVNIKDEDLETIIISEFGEDRADLILECVGVDSTISQAIAYARKGSEIIIVGVFGDKAAVDLGLVQDRELTLIGTLMYRKEDFEIAIELVKQAKINFKPLLSRRFTFADYSQAYNLIDREGDKIMKILIDVQEE